MTDKLAGYLGFAAKARKLSGGYNTCLFLLSKRKAKVVIIAEDASDGTKDKISQKCRSAGATCYIYGTGEELSHVTGNSRGTVFTVTDKDFAEVISREIDRIRSEGETTNAKESI